MLARYSAAKTVDGTIVLRQTAGSVSVGVETTLRYERPARLSLRQVRRSAEPRTWWVTSDGKTFSYDAPPETAPRPGQRLIERVLPGMTIGDLYAAASRSLGDRSAPLDIAIGRPEHLRFLTRQWATMAFAADRKLGEDRVRVIAGRWREYGDAAVTGTFEMWVEPDGTLRRYVLRETIAPDPRLGPQQVTSTWDVNLRIGVSIDPDAFKVIR
jgi:hypothetical protein